MMSTQSVLHKYLYSGGGALLARQDGEGVKNIYIGTLHLPISVSMNLCCLNLRDLIPGRFFINPGKWTLAGDNF